MNVLLISDPPLGQATVVSQEWVRFTVLLEFLEPAPCGEKGWGVALWHNGHLGQEWGESRLDRITDNRNVELFNLYKPEDPHCLYFTGVVHRTSPQLSFTVKFRSESQEWAWIKDHSGQEDGHILFQTTESIPGDLSDYISDIPSTLLSVASHLSMEATKLWSITAPVEEAIDLKPGILNLPLGKPHNLISFFALVRVSIPWLAPRQGKQSFSLTEDAILCSFLRSDGLHLVLLAVSVLDVLTIIKSQDGNIVISARNDLPRPGKAFVIAAVGKEFETANTAVISAAKDLVSQIEPNGDIPRPLLAVSKEAPSVDRFSFWVDGLTYCTWNGLGQDLTEDKIYHALDILRDNGVLVTNLIIDDNWQSLDNPGANQYKRGWTDFEANKEGFPRGLKHLTSTIRKNYPNIKHIAVWHGLFGYWGGFSPDGNLARKYKSKQVEKIAEGFGDGQAGLVTVVDAGNIRQMCYDFYDFLTQSGINAVKIDNQYLLDCLDHPQDRTDLINAYQDAWRDAALQFFGSQEDYRMISCMSLMPQTIFHSHLSPSPDSPRYMLRNSDDFFPDDPTSHSWHVFCNAHCALLTQHFHTLPDYDMFQTTHAYSGFHAAARCVSGGPIYFTDEPGEHNISLINQITAPTIAGERIILRPNTAGKSMQVYSDHREAQFCKLGAFHYISEPTDPSEDFDVEEKRGASILVIFNTASSSKERTEFIRGSDFPFPEDVPTHGAGSNDIKYIVRSHTTGNISIPMSIRREDREDTGLSNLIPITLPERGYEILTAYELQSDSIPTFAISPSDPLSSEVFSLAEAPNNQVVKRSKRVSSTLHITALGLLGKMTSAAAITSAEYSFSPKLEEIKGTRSGCAFSTQEVKALGKVGVYYLISASPTFPTLNSHPPSIRIHTKTSATLIGNKTMKKGSTEDQNPFPVRVVNSVPEKYITTEPVLDDNVGDRERATTESLRKAGVVIVDLERAWAEMSMAELVRVGHENGFVRVRVEVSVEVVEFERER